MQTLFHLATIKFVCLHNGVVAWPFQSVREQIKQWYPQFSPNLPITRIKSPSPSQSKAVLLSLCREWRIGSCFSMCYRVFLRLITAEIHACSLANCYCQHADRHMNLKCMRHVSEREPAIRQFVIVKHKLMSVFNASALLLIMNFVITLSK